MSRRVRETAHRVLLGRERGRVRLEGRAVEGVDGEERAQVQDLVYGVRRRLWVLDAVLRRFLSRPLRDAAPELREALRIGVHDLLFRSRIPRPMVVSETVALGGRGGRFKGVLNAVLRRVADDFEFVDFPEGSPADRHRVWVAPGRAARFERPILPDPRVDPAQHDAIQWSLPAWFCAAIRELLPLEAEAFFASSVGRLPVALRAVDEASLDVLAAELEAEGVEVLGRVGPILEIHPHRPVESIRSVAEGRAFVQDLAAGEALDLLAVRPGERILDLCAPPGGKARRIAAALGPEGTLVAAHVGQRVELLERSLAAVDPSARTRLHDLGRDGTRMPEESFDAVLVDAPCSNTGVLMKRVDARYRLRDEELGRLERLQARLLARAADRVVPGGRLVYATCSIVPGENQKIVREFLAARPDFELVEERLRYPQRTGRDGGFAARLERRSSAQEPTNP